MSMHVSDYIKTGRENLGLSQEQFAKGTNFNLESVKAWESGKREPSSKSLMRIMMLLGMPESLQIFGQSYAFQGGQLSVHKGVYTPKVLEKWSKK